MEWLMQWNENYSLVILLFGVFACVICLIVYLAFSYKKLLQELNRTKRTKDELQSKSTMIEQLSRELASQIEQEVDIYYIKLSDLDNVDLSLKQISNISFMILDEEKEEEI